jgi:hypothetical protein
MFLTPLLGIIKYEGLHGIIYRVYDDASLVYLGFFLSAVIIGFCTVYSQINYFDSLKDIKDLNYIFILPKSNYFSFIFCITILFIKRLQYKFTFKKNFMNIKRCLQKYLRMFMMFKQD